MKTTPQHKSDADIEAFLRRCIPFGVLAAFVLLLVISFPPFTQAWGVLVFLVPFVKWSFARPRWRIYLATALAATWSAWFFILIWLRHIYPGWGWLALLLLSGQTAMFPFLWLVMMRWAAPRLDGAPRARRLLGLLGLAGFWVVLDWVRLWLFSGFPWLPLAAAFWKFPLFLQLAQWTGSWGVTFLIVLLNLGWVCGTGPEPLKPGGAPARRWKRIWWPARFGPEIYIPLLLFQGAILLALQLVLRESSQIQPMLRVGFVQPWVAANEKWDKASFQKNWGTLSSLTLGMRTRGVDVVLWPEAAMPFPVTGPDAPAYLSALQSVVDEVGHPLVMGGIGEVPPTPGSNKSPGDYDGIFVMNPGAGLEPESYAKRHLVPFGEYVPMRTWLPFLGKVVPGRDTIPGDHPQVLPLTLRGGRTLQLGPLVCYEDVFPNLARDQVKAGAEVLVVLTNDGWYGTGGGALQHAAHSVLRAIETRRPVLRCGNDGWSGVIDQDGAAFPLVKNADAIGANWVLLASGTTYFRGAGVMNLGGNPLFAGKETFYVRFGDWFVALSALLAMLGIAALRRPKA